MEQRVALIAAAETAEEFGACLRAAREHTGLTLAEITRRCKVATSHLEALERGDISRWPQGIYRRSFLRDYVNAIGVPLEHVSGTFARVFPDADSQPEGEADGEKGEKGEKGERGEKGAVTPDAGDAPRALPDSGPRPLPRLPDTAHVRAMLTSLRDWRAWTAERALGALADITVVVILGMMVGMFAGSGLMSGIGISALIYYPVSTACVGRGLACWWLENVRDDAPYAAEERRI